MEDRIVWDDLSWWALNCLYGIDLPASGGGAYLHDDEQVRQWLAELRKRRAMRSRRSAVLQSRSLPGCTRGVRVREIDDDEGRRLLRVIRRGTGSVVTWRRAQMVMLSAQGISVARVAEVTFTSADRIRDVIHNFNTDGFDSFYPKYKGGRPKTFTLPSAAE